MLNVILIVENKEGDVLTVRYNPYSYEHDIWEDGLYLGKLRIRELYKGGFVCIGREFTIDE